MIGAIAARLPAARHQPSECWAFGVKPHQHLLPGTGICHARKRDPARPGRHGSSSLRLGELSVVFLVHLASESLDFRLVGLRRSLDQLLDRLVLEVRLTQIPLRD